MNKTSIEEQAQRSEPEERPGRRATRLRSEIGGGQERRGIDLARLREIGRNLGTQVGEQARKRPYTALGAAAGFGFVAGSLFGSRLGQVLLAGAIGYVAKNVLGGELGVQQLQENLEKLARDRVKG